MVSGARVRLRPKLGICESVYDNLIESTLIKLWFNLQDRSLLPVIDGILPQSLPNLEALHVSASNGQKTGF